MTATDYAQAYLNHIRFERNLSAYTHQHYQRDLELLNRLSDNAPYQDIAPIHIRRFVATLHSRGLHSKSIARALSTWRGFYRYLIHHHGFEQNPALGLRPPKAEKSLPQTLSIEQAIQLVDVREADILSLRDHAMLELFYASGLRLAELVNLNRNWLDFVEGTVTVTGKGRKMRVIPMTTLAAEALQKWLIVRGTLPVAEEHADVVFVSQQGKPLTPRAVQLRLKQWAIKQSIDSNVHPHLLRHSFASHVLQSSQDLRAVQEMLGHANISTTQIYTHLDYQHLALVYDVAHPRAKKK